MRRFILSIKIWFKTLFYADVADQVERLLKGELTAEPAPAAIEAPPKPVPPPPAPKRPVRSEALTFLAALQREARFVDFIQERLDDYTDEQIGAAARDVHRDCGKVIARMFALQPISTAEEGAIVEVGDDAEFYRLTGNVTGKPPFRGRLVHHGWKATMCELPEWTGSEKAALVVAPAEVEL